MEKIFTAANHGPSLPTNKRKKELLINRGTLKLKLQCCEITLYSWSQGHTRFDCKIMENHV